MLFVLPISWPCVNFTVLPLLLELALFFWFLRVARTANVRRSWLVVLSVLALSVGFSRAQGLFVLIVLAATSLVAPRRGRTNALAFAVTAILLAPIPLLLGFYALKVGDPLAFYHAQKTWGRSLSTPWAPWVTAFANGHVIAYFHDLAFTLLRALLTIAAIGYASYRCLKERPADEAGLRERDAEVGVLAASVVLWLLPSMTGVLLGMNRLYCFAMYPLVTSPRRNPAMMIGSLPLLALCLLRVAEVVLFFQNRYFAIW